METTTRTHVLAPSAFGFLWEECKCCYYRQVVNNDRRPSSPFPAIFSKIDSAMKHRFAGDKWHSFGPLQPQFQIAYDEQLVTSQPIIFPRHQTAIVLRGKYDSILRFNDGRLVVCDFKTSSVKPEYLEKYWIQLHAYVYALEHPESRSLGLPRVDAIGLAVFEPADFAYDSNSRATLGGSMQWVGLERDDERFMRFLDEVATVLKSPFPPAPSPKCQYCRYRLAA